MRSRPGHCRAGTRRGMRALACGIKLRGSLRTLGSGIRTQFLGIFNESNGMEDARCSFVEDDDSPLYALIRQGRSLLPNSSRDRLPTSVRAVNGRAVRQGMALFPRRLDGRYAMIHADGPKPLPHVSGNPHVWSDPQILRDARTWRGEDWQLRSPWK